MSDLQYQAVYNVLCFALASMMATTMFLWFRAGAVKPQFRSAVLISGLVTFIAAYHYIRIFNSWVDAYEYQAPHYDRRLVAAAKVVAPAVAKVVAPAITAAPAMWQPAITAAPAVVTAAPVVIAVTHGATIAKAVGASVINGALEGSAPVMTGIPFNDAYRYMDWLLTVPLLLLEILLVMKLPEGEFTSKSWTLGFGSALMIISGYYGELVVSGDLTPRWACWFLSMVFFLNIVYELLVGLSEATNSETDPVVQSKIRTAQVMTVISWCTYPVVYLFPMLGIDAAHAVVSIQFGYCVSDIISKCGVGILIYQITYAKSLKETVALDHYEEFYGMESGSATADQVKDSALGVTGWSADGPKFPPSRA